MVASLMLRASSDVLAQARDELSRKGYAPLQLSRDLGLAVQLIENFLNGEIVDRNTYELLCDKLNIHLNFGQEKLPESIENDELSILNNNQSLSRSNEAVTTHDAHLYRLQKVREYPNMKIAIKIQLKIRSSILKLILMNP